MALKFGKGKTQKFSAGISIHEGFLYFAELDENSQLKRKLTVKLSEGCVINGSIKNFAQLEKAFSELVNNTGKIKEPVNIGLPAADAIIRPITLPKMSLEDITSTLDLNFEEYFPFARFDAVFNAIIIRTPEDINNNGEEITVLAAAARKNIVDRILECAKKSGISVGMIEPVNFAMLRSVPEARSGLCVFVAPESIAASWEGNGILFRAADNRNGLQDILNTIRFVETQYRNTDVDKLILAGLNFQIRTESELTIIDVNDPFFDAKGLAMAGRNHTQVLDLRPEEYIKQEKRRYSFNLSRLIFWTLFAGLVIISIGTAAVSFRGILNLGENIEQLRVGVNDMRRRRLEITEANSKLEQQQNRTEKILNFLKSDIPVLEIMNAIEMNSASGTRLNTADFSRSSKGDCTAQINGTAPDEDSLVSLSDGLKESGLFDNVNIPISQKNSSGRITFRLVMTIKELTQ